MYTMINTTKHDPKAPHLAQEVNHTITQHSSLTSLLCYCVYPISTHQAYEYGRSGNPTRTVLETCLAKLDGGLHGLTFASGLGATTAIAQMLSAGDHILIADDVYGGTNRLFSKVLSRNGLSVQFVDMTDADAFAAAIRPETRVGG